MTAIKYHVHHFSFGQANMWNLILSGKHFLPYSSSDWLLHFSFLFEDVHSCVHVHLRPPFLIVEICWFKGIRLFLSYKKIQDFFSLKIREWVISPFLDTNHKETGTVNKYLVSLQNDIELKPKFKKLYQDFKPPPC